MAYRWAGVRAARDFGLGAVAINAHAGLCVAPDLAALHPALAAVGKKQPAVFFIVNPAK